MTAAKTVASLSLDLDNHWSYLRTRGDARWAEYPSYLDTVVPLALRMLDDLGVRITFFVVGRDADACGPGGWLGAIADAGHEIGNHSYSHEPWLHRQPLERIEAEIADTEAAIERATGTRPVGFRGPGYSLSPELLRLLQRRGYAYDASTLPTWIGPLARAFYFRSTRFDGDDAADRAELFGHLADGRRRLRPYRWDLPGGPLVEIPVTTLPGLRVPMHLSYVLYLEAVAPAAARQYFRAALAACRVAGVGPSILVHPLDLVGADDLPSSGLEFFPAMNLPGARKRLLVRDCLARFAAAYDVGSVGRHARAVADGPLVATDAS